MSTSTYESGSALRKVYVLVFSQLISRVFTFALNACVARSVGLAVFGLFSVNLYLVDAIILMLGREGIHFMHLFITTK